MEVLLKDGSTHDGHSDSLYRVLTLTVRPTRRVSRKMIAPLIVSLIAYIRSLPGRLDLYGGFLKRWECPWWSLQKLISGSHPDG